MPKISDLDYVSEIDATSYLLGVKGGSTVRFPASVLQGEDPVVNTTFISQGDTPTSYVGQTGKLVAVNTAEDALEFIDAPTSLPVGGTAGQVLTKNSATEGDAGWAAASGGTEIPSSTTAPESPSDGDLWLDESQGVAEFTNYIDVTNRTTDYPLRRGETAIVNYSAATSVPLHIKTVEGIYEIIVTGNRTTAIANNNAGIFYPNNTSGQTFLGTYRWAGGSSGVASAYTDCQVAEGRLSKCYVRAHTTTSAKSLSIRYSFQKSDSSAWFAEIETDWIDTTTTWSSLGTVNLPFAQSGTIIIRRIY